MGSLFLGVVTGAFGLAYIVYGKRQTKFVPFVSGVLLCTYSYFVTGWVALSVVGALLLIAPFVVDF